MKVNKSECAISKCTWLISRFEELHVCMPAFLQVWTSANLHFCKTADDVQFLKFAYQPGNGTFSLGHFYPLTEFLSPCFLLVFFWLRQDQLVPPSHLIHLSLESPNSQCVCWVSWLSCHIYSRIPARGRSKSKLSHPEIVNQNLVHKIDTAIIIAHRLQHTSSLEGTIANDSPVQYCPRYHKELFQVHCYSLCTSIVCPWCHYI